MTHLRAPFGHERGAFDVADDLVALILRPLKAVVGSCRIWMVSSVEVCPYEDEQNGEYASY